MLRRIAIVTTLQKFSKMFNIPHLHSKLYYNGRPMNFKLQIKVAMF